MKGTVTLDYDDTMLLAALRLGILMLRNAKDRNEDIDYQIRVDTEMAEYIEKRIKMR